MGKIQLVFYLATSLNTQGTTAFILMSYPRSKVEGEILYSHDVLSTWFGEQFFGMRNVGSI